MDNTNLIATSIFTQSINATEQYCGYFVVSDQIKTSVIFEFIFLYIHLLSRGLLNRYGIEKRNLSTDKVKSIIIGSFIQAKMSNATDKARSELRDGIAKVMNEREVLYGKCKNITGDSSVPFNDSVITKFAKNITAFLNDQDPEKAKIYSTEIALSNWSELVKKMNM